MTFKEKDQPCPNCGEEDAIPRIWMGFNPPICPNCGKPAWKNPKVVY